MSISKTIICIGITSLFILTGLTGCVEQVGPNTGLILIPSASATNLGSPKYAMAKYYSSEEVRIEASVPQYSLPLELSDIVNFNSLDSLFDLNDQQQYLLKANGFVVRNYWTDEDDIIEPYNYIKENDIPIFVTSDTLLHLYHIQFDEILKGIEEREFFDFHFFPYPDVPARRFELLDAYFKQHRVFVLLLRAFL